MGCGRLGMFSFSLLPFAWLDRHTSYAFEQGGEQSQSRRRFESVSSVFVFVLCIRTPCSVRVTLSYLVVVVVVVVVRSKSERGGRAGGCEA